MNFGSFMKTPFQASLGIVFLRDTNVFQLSRFKICLTFNEAGQHSLGSLPWEPELFTRCFFKEISHCLGQNPKKAV